MTTPRLQVYVDVKTRNTPTMRVGYEKIDNFASNKSGFVIGSSVFFTGTSGAGKTSFSIFLQKLFENEITALYSREMPACDVKEQTERFGISHRNALIADKDDCANVGEFIKAIDEVKPRIVIIDSLQVLLQEDCHGEKASDDLWNLIADLRSWTSKNNAILFVIGHVNKEGEFEGKNTIKHMFDAHMHMNFDQKKNERTLSWTKNRKGDTAVKLYYEFTADSMVFYTEEEWASRAGKRDIMDVVYGAVQGFISSLNKNHVNYSEFKSAYNEGIKEIANSELESQMELTIAVMQLADKLTKQYGLVA